MSSRPLKTSRLVEFEPLTRDRTEPTPWLLTWRAAASTMPDTVTVLCAAADAAQVPAAAHSAIRVVRFMPLVSGCRDGPNLRDGCRD